MLLILDIEESVSAEIALPVGATSQVITSKMRDGEIMVKVQMPIEKGKVVAQKGSLTIS